ncbi:hypothetical protein GCM10022205_19780 [Spinactinospora alkalitolerans]
MVVCARLASTPFAGMIRIRFVRSEAHSLPLSRVPPGSRGVSCSTAMLERRGAVGATRPLVTAHHYAYSDNAPCPRLDSSGMWEIG